MRHLDKYLYRYVVILLLTSLAAAVTAASSSNVYSKEEIDYKFKTTAAYEQQRHVFLNQDIAEMKSDIKWIVRSMGGNDDTYSRESNHTPQSD